MIFWISKAPRRNLTSRFEVYLEPRELVVCGIRVVDTRSRSNARILTTKCLPTLSIFEPMISNSAKAQVERKCPKCRSADTARSQRVDLEDRLLSLMNRYPYRCQQQACKQRFHAFGRH